MNSLIAGGNVSRHLGHVLTVAGVACLLSFLLTVNVLAFLEIGAAQGIQDVEAP